MSRLVSLFMETTGEDKQNLLEMLYYGLLRVPFPQYLRIQLNTEAEGLDEKHKEADAKKLREKALEAMDDSSQATLDVYRVEGQQLAKRHKADLQKFVEKFLVL